MIATHSANEINRLTDAADGSVGTEGLSLAESSASDELAELEELDDDVEALIVRMDRTTAEHLFLHAQRLM
jgi:hypothetical protein